MKKWFSSLKGAVLFSAVAMLVFIGYTLIEMLYFLGEWISSDGAAIGVAVIVLLIVGGWLRALFVAAGGRQSGLIALFAFSLFITLIALYDMQFVLFSPMHWPEQVTVIIMLVVGIINATVLAVQIKRNRKIS